MDVAYSAFINLYKSAYDSALPVFTAKFVGKSNGPKQPWMSLWSVSKDNFGFSKVGKIRDYREIGGVDLFACQLYFIGLGYVFHQNYYHSK